MTDLVTIITPVYNNESTITDCLESVLNQSYTHWELFVINDASEDDSCSLANEIAKNDVRIRVFDFKQNRGAAEARNFGTRKANGTYIAFLDADDIWFQKKLEIQLNTMRRYDIDVCFSSYSLISSKGEDLNLKINAIPKLGRRKLLKSNYVGNLTGIYNCSRLGKIYTINLRKRQDWLLWLEALKRSDKDAYGIQKSLAYYRLGQNNLSSRKVGLLKYNFDVYHKGLKFSVFKSMICLFAFLFEYFFVKPKFKSSTR